MTSGFCRKCGANVNRSDEHYVSAVGHFSGLGEPTEEPYWQCERYPMETIMRQVAI